VFDAAEFPLEGFKDIKNAAGVTINDVALGIVGGALLRYLKAKGEAPEEGSLAAALPLNMRTRRGVTEDNNQVGSVFASLHTDIEDPIERLAAIRQSTEEAKLNGEASPLVDSLMLAGVFAPGFTKSIAGFWSRNEISRYLPVNVSTCISNVMGPDFPLYCAGARMVDYYGLGVLTPGLGIFHLVFSYAGKVTLSVLADRDIIPDPELYHDCLVQSYEELHAATVDPKSTSKNTKAVAARARIDTPRRKRVQAEQPATGSKPSKKKKAAATKAKVAKTAKRKAAGKAAAKVNSAAAGTAKSKAKAKTRAKTATTARRKTPAKAKAKAAAKRKAPTKVRSKAGTKGRPSARRRATGPARPKLKASA
jgi:hypothetical protein